MTRIRPVVSVVLLATALLWAGGCTKKIQVQRLKAGTSDICGIGKVGIGSFKAGAPKISPALASTVVGKLTQGIANEKHLEFFERNPEELGKIAREIEQFHDKGNLTQKSLTALQSAGLEGILFGEITAAAVKDSERREQFDVQDEHNRPRTIWVTYRQRTADLTINYKLVDVRPESPCGTLRTLVAQSENESGTWEMQVGGDATAAGVSGAVDATLGALFSSGDKPSGRAQRVSVLPSETTLFDELAGRSVTKFLVKVQPHRETGAVRMKDPSTPKGELGLGYAMNCNWSQAEKTFEDAIREGTALTGADYYNLAVIKELRGCRKEATGLMGKAVELEPSDADAIEAHSKLLANQGLGTFEESFDPLSTSSKEVCTIQLGCGGSAASELGAVCRTVDSMTLRATGSRDGAKLQTFKVGTELTVVDDTSNPQWSKVHIDEGGASYDGWGFKKSYQCPRQ